MPQPANHSALNYIATDELQRPLIMWGTAVPSNSQAGIPGGAIYIRIHESSAAIYQNTGTVTSTTWTQNS